MDVIGSWMVCPEQNILLLLTTISSLNLTVLPTSTSSTSSCSMQGTSFNKSYKSNSDETYIDIYLVVLGFRKSWTSNGQNLDFSTWRNQWFNKLFYRCFVPLLLIKPMELAVAENPRSSNNPPAVELRSEQRHFAPLPWPENPLSPRVVTTADSANGH